MLSTLIQKLNRSKEFNYNLAKQNTVRDSYWWNKPHTIIGTPTLICLFFQSVYSFPALLFVLSPLTALSLFSFTNDSTLEWKGNSYLTQSRRNYWNVFKEWWLTRICCNSFCYIILCGLVTEIWGQEPVSILLTLDWIDKCPTDRLSLFFLLDLRMDSQ